MVFSSYNKIIFIILLIFFQFICNYYSFNLVNFYYIRRMHLLQKLNRSYDELKLITFEDKINWIAVHDVNRLKGKCADKILLHQYSKRILKKDICNKILKIYDDPSKIDFSELPEQFVLKTNHGSGFNIIVNNKTNLNIKNAKKNLHDWLQYDYGANTGQFHYSFIKRKAFAEEYIGSSLNNYKFMCYNSVPIFVYLSKKFNNRKYRTFYDMNWKKLDFDCLSEKDPFNIYPKPKTFELMKKYAHKLSRPFKFVRIDLYEYKGEVRLGELTFTPMNGHFLCKKPEHNIELGKYLKLFK